MTLFFCISRPDCGTAGGQKAEPNLLPLVINPDLAHLFLLCLFQSSVQQYYDCFLIEPPAHPLDSEPCPLGSPRSESHSLIQQTFIEHPLWAKSAAGCYGNKGMPSNPCPKRTHIPLEDRQAMDNYKYVTRGTAATMGNRGKKLGLLAKGRS